jgi:hypothetical protein
VRGTLGGEGALLKGGRLALAEATSTPDCLHPPGPRTDHRCLRLVTRFLPAPRDQRDRSGRWSCSAASRPRPRPARSRPSWRGCSGRDSPSSRPRCSGRSAQPLRYAGRVRPDRAAATASVGRRHPGRGPGDRRSGPPRRAWAPISEIRHNGIRGPSSGITSGSAGRAAARRRGPCRPHEPTSPDYGCRPRCARPASRLTSGRTTPRRCSRTGACA